MGKYQKCIDKMNITFYDDDGNRFLGFVATQWYLSIQ
jgi:hypothetical protein